jgi:hypothetical protein
MMAIDGIMKRAATRLDGNFHGSTRINSVVVEDLFNVPWILTETDMLKCVQDVSLDKKKWPMAL